MKRICIVLIGFNNFQTCIINFVTVNISSHIHLETLIILKTKFSQNFDKLWQLAKRPLLTSDKVFPVVAGWRRGGDHEQG